MKMYAALVVLCLLFSPLCAEEVSRAELVQSMQAREARLERAAVVYDYYNPEDRLRYRVLEAWVGNLRVRELLNPNADAEHSSYRQMTAYDGSIVWAWNDRGNSASITYPTAPLEASLLRSSESPVYLTIRANDTSDPLLSYLWSDEDMEPSFTQAEAERRLAEVTGPGELLKLYYSQRRVEVARDGGVVEAVVQIPMAPESPRATIYRHWVESDGFINRWSMSLPGWEMPVVDCKVLSSNVFEDKKLPVEYELELGVPSAKGESRKSRVVIRKWILPPSLKLDETDFVLGEFFPSGTLVGIAGDPAGGYVVKENGERSVDYSEHRADAAGKMISFFDLLTDEGLDFFFSDLTGEPSYRAALDKLQLQDQEALHSPNPSGNIPSQIMGVTPNAAQLEQMKRQ